MITIVTGATGFVGAHLIDAWRKEGRCLIPTSLTGENPLDITNKNEVMDFFKWQREQNPSEEIRVIQGAVMGNADGCQRNPILSREINYYGTEHVALATKKIGAKLTLLSSVAVLSGTDANEKGRYTEKADTLTPPTVYGKDKADAERRVLEIDEHTIIPRYDLVIGINGRNKRNGFAGQVLTGESLSVNDYQARTPISLYDIPGAIDFLNDNEISGVVNLACPGDTISKLRIGQLLEGVLRPQRYISCLTEVKKGEQAARRADSTALDISFAKQLGIPLRSLDETIVRMQDYEQREGRIGDEIMISSFARR